MNDFLTKLRKRNTKEVFKILNEILDEVVRQVLVGKKFWKVIE